MNRTCLETRIFWMRGMANAAVFPEPVRARARMSFPVRASGMAFSWMRVGFSQPWWAIACNIYSLGGLLPATYTALVGYCLQHIQPWWAIACNIYNIDGLLPATYTALVGYCLQHIQPWWAIACNIYNLDGLLPATYTALVGY